MNIRKTIPKIIPGPSTRSTFMGPRACQGRRSIVRLACVAAAMPRLAFAQEYPSRPVKIVVPFAPGGGNDVFARHLASGMTEVLKQQVIVENRAGAGGTLGSDIVAKAAPDGYTLLL